MARGNEVIVNNNLNLITVIDKLNNGEVISFDELQNHLSTNWELMDIFDFISQLWQIGAISIYNE